LANAALISSSLEIALPAMDGMHVVDQVRRVSQGNQQAAVL
jgi:hypothetical protein